MSILLSSTSSKVIAGVVGTALFGGMIGAAVLSAPDVEAAEESVRATVVDVVDGDTIDVTYDGEQHRVRLLNIDTPETVDPDEPVECLGPQATDYLQDALPPGTTVSLEFDEERTDGYDRELAGVLVDGRLINAEIAREGLGVAIAVEPNTKFYDQVRAAQLEAEDQRRGLFSPTVDCSLVAQVQALEAAAAAEPLPPTAPPADIAAAGAELDSALVAAAGLIAVLDGDPQLFPLLALDGDRIQHVSRRVSVAEARLQERRTANARTYEQATRAAAQRAVEPPAPQAAEQPAPVVPPRPAPSAGSSSGGGVHAPAPAPRPAPAPAPAPVPPPPPPPPGPTGGSDTYTGCRAYGPNGTSIDDLGRRYTKIDCTTRRPIG